MEKRPGVAERIMLASMRGLGILASAAAAAHRDGISHGFLAVLLCEAGLERNVMVRVWRQCPPRGHVAKRAVLIAIDDFVLGASTILPPHLHPKKPLAQGTGGVEIGGEGVTGLVVFLERGIDLDTPAPGLGHLARDEVDHAADGVGTVKR